MTLLQQGSPKAAASPEVANGVGAYIDWIRQSALPFWGTSGRDPEAGRFHERLDFGGKPIAIPQRAMVQARQIYVFAHAAQIGWFEEGYAFAAAALRSVRNNFIEEDTDMASCAFSIDERGTVVSQERDTYTHAFILLSLASMYALDGERVHLQLADKILTFADRKLSDRLHGGLIDRAGAPQSAPKRQNPLMHMLEACIFLAEAAPGRGYEARAEEIARLFEERILGAGRAYLAEHFAGDWSEHPDRRQAQKYEPGHLLEWAWLLERVRWIGSPDRSNIIDALIEKAFAAVGSPQGLIPDEVDAENGNAVSRFRLWPHTEALKVASLVQIAAVKPSADHIAGLILQHFVGAPFDGGWIDRLDAAGKPLVDHVPASSLYHLMLAAAEAAAIETGGIS